MEITAKELRGKPGQIIEQAARGTEVIITLRGEKMARLIAYKTSTKNNDREIKLEDEIFGLWKERDDIEAVDNYVRSIRKRRAF
jgi:prevent-host-death family protein